jgi:hypothetical protein
MHMLWSILLIIGAILSLVLGLFGVLRDLIDRSPYQAPVIQEDGLAQPPRYPGTAPSAPPTDLPASTRRFACTRWPSERNSGQT